MAEKRGCFKTGCLGCLGVLGVGLLFLVILAGVAWNGARDKEVVDRELSAPTEVAQLDAPDVVSGEAREALASPKGGRLVLNLNQGEFELHRGAPGQELTIKANFDDDIYNLEDKFETLPDSTWVYQVRFYRTIGGMQALLRQVFGGGHNNSIHVYLPPDVPIELVIDSEEGGFEADLGGLWLTSADISFAKGGFALEISEPLHEPVDSFVIRSRMGGFDAQGLGNASPHRLVVESRMGGAQVDLSGQWLNDCTAQMSIRMGGMAVVLPDGINILGVATDGSDLTRTDQELGLPTLSLSLTQSMGEIDVVR
jgi:hypothetical protein|nr:hypothetical protein [Candidatus Krumholzibacteria bacterium]